MTEYKLTTLKPSRSEPLRFKGRIIADTEWDTKSGDWMRFEIWETQGGAYIAVIVGNVPGEDREDLTAAVFPPQDDEFERRVAVLRFFDGHDRARSMIRSKLKWSLLREVA